MSLAPPPPVSTNPLLRMLADIRAERTVDVPFPPGDTDPSLERTQRFMREPLPILLDAYERYGPVFTLRLLHGKVVFALGPEANHHITVSNAANFSYRNGSMGDLMPLLGDGLLTIDGEFHRRSRKVMLPAFHRDRIAAAVSTMTEETEAALARWEPGAQVDLYDWTRNLALRIAMRALFGLDPDHAGDKIDAAHEFEVALGFWGRDPLVQILRGPLTPWARMLTARKRLDSVIYDEIDRRRETGARGEDLLSLLLDATDEDGRGLDRRHIRDEVMTLLFAGHDTTTATIAFLFYELARAPELLDDPSFDLDLAIDETLRLYPPAWIGPRRAVGTFELGGVRVPGGAPVNYCSWASHRLPDVWGEPDAFRPERFAPGRREQIPKGAYIPFGGGSRTCIGMRFGQAEVGVIATAILERFRLELPGDFELVVRQTPTLGPGSGLPMVVRDARRPAGRKRRPAAAA
jgi:cytochrome P450